MARKETTTAAEISGDTVPELVAIEDLFAKHQTPAWARAGLMRRMRWAAGRRVTEAEFIDALKTWRNGPMG